MNWISLELPPELPAACVVRAAQHYSVPAELIVSMLKVEGGMVGRVYPRSHGTYYGPSQLSDKWLPVFARWGFSAQTLQHDACANIAAGTYVLAYYRQRAPDWPHAIARYNVGSLTSPEREGAGRRYAAKVLSHWSRLYEKWGSNAYATQH